MRAAAEAPEAALAIFVDAALELLPRVAPLMVAQRGGISAAVRARLDDARMPTLLPRCAQSPARALTS